MIQFYPLHSLIEGSWFKLICGASYQNLPWVRNLALAYSIAGADCIDVAADIAVIAAAKEGINVARELSQQAKLFSARQNYDCQTPIQAPLKVNSRFVSPWLMASINDGEDPHFRKAKFDAEGCPSGCPQPCVGVCPADAIDLDLGGVIEDLCYGCGRCLPICPQDLIGTRSHISSPEEIASLIELKQIDALEIHTQVGHYDNFKRVWTILKPVACHLKLLAISCTDGENAVNYLRSLYRLVEPLPCPLIWQTDGRSMSGDIGKGTTHAAIFFAQKVLEGNLPGYIQLAGGTNNHTVAKLARLQMLQRQNKLNKTDAVSGVAYGSYARTVLSPILNQLETTELQNIHPNLIKSQPMNQLLNPRSDRAFSFDGKTTSDLKLEQDRDLLAQAVAIASQLVNQIKQASY